MATLPITCLPFVCQLYYSVPHQLVRRPVEVRATTRVVEVFHRGRRIASHVREYGRRRFITTREHMSASHRAHLEWTPSKLINDRFLAWAEQICNTRQHTKPVCWALKGGQPGRSEGGGGMSHPEPAAPGAAVNLVANCTEDAVHG
jgi:hypothetical protein